MANLLYWCRNKGVLVSLVSTLLGVNTLAAQSAQELPGRAGEGGGFSLPAGLDGETKARLLPILERAQDRGLPVQALTAKVAEGVLRGVPSAKIVAAVEAVEERLTTANLALAPASARDIVAGADALAAGVKVNTLRSIRKYQPKSSVAVPLAVLAQLISQGVSQNRATDIVFKLLQRGATPQQLLALRQAVYDDISAGTSASQAFDARAAMVLSALGRTAVDPVTMSSRPADAISLSGSGKKK